MKLFYNQLTGLSSHRRTVTAFVIALGLASSACRGDCAGIGLTELRPSQQVTLAVGGSFTAEYWDGGECLGTSRRHLDRIDGRWWTLDTLVIRVDSVSGAVRGLRPGDARLWFRVLGAPADSTARRGEIQVHVL